MSTPSAIVLAAGDGTRMRSTTPKVLHPICGREIVGLVVDNVLHAGLGPVVVVTPPDGAGIRNALGDSVLYAEQSEPRGTGHAANQARDLLPDEETIVVLAGQGNDDLERRLELANFKVVTQRPAGVTYDMAGGSYETPAGL